jgi:hypothetical protein
MATKKTVIPNGRGRRPERGSGEGCLIVGPHPAGCRHCDNYSGRRLDHWSVDGAQLGPSDEVTGSAFPSRVCDRCAILKVGRKAEPFRERVCVGSGADDSRRLPAVG